MPIIPANNVEIRDEGTTQGRVRIVDFAGAGVTAAVSGSVATITIAGGGGSDPSYSPGTLTIATETARLFMNHVKLTTTQRITVAGTGRMRVSN